MLKFGLIGVGRMGLRHAFNLAHGFCRGVKLQAVCDIDPIALKKAKRFAKKANQYTSYIKMLEQENLDAVIIATQHYAHEEIAIYCIKKGINTLIEKPLTVTKLAGQRVVEVAKENPQVLVGVSFNQRSNKMYMRAKRLIESGRLGEVQRADYIITNWYRSQAYYSQGGWRASYCGEGGGCLINQSVHQLDILQWLLGMPKAITAVMATKDRKINVENEVFSIFEYPEFCCMFSTSSHEISGVNRLEIALDKGRIVIGSYFMKIYWHKSQKQVNKETTFGYGATPSFVTRHSYGIRRAISDLIFGQQLRSIRAFARELQGKGKQLAGVDSGLKATELVNAIYLSAWTDKKVCLPLNASEYENQLSIKKEDEKGGLR